MNTWQENLWVPTDTFLHLSFYVVWVYQYAPLFRKQVLISLLTLYRTTSEEDDLGRALSECEWTCRLTAKMAKSLERNFSGIWVNTMSLLISAVYNYAFT
jgi:hypothetical protein